MKFELPFLISILALTASADKHRLCCCAGYDECGLFNCDGGATQNVIDGSGKKFARATKAWDKGQGAPIGGPLNWMYATFTNGEDGFLGGDEVSGLCDKQGKNSRCFTPKSDYNSGYKIKGREVSVEANSFAEAKIKPSTGKGGKSASNGKSKKGKKPKSEGENEHWPVCN